jgi:hypothetical protein
MARVLRVPHGFLMSYGQDFPVRSRQQRPVPSSRLLCGPQASAHVVVSDDGQQAAALQNPPSGCRRLWLGVERLKPPSWPGIAPKHQRVVAEHDPSARARRVETRPDGFINSFGTSGRRWMTVSCPSVADMMQKALNVRFWHKADTRVGGIERKGKAPPPPPVVTKG